MESKQFVIDMEHRYNSIYLFLKSGEGYEAFITEYYISRQTRNDDEIVLVETNWKLAFKVKFFLTSFYDSINILLGVYYSTSSKVLEHPFVIIRTYNKYKNDPD